MIIPEVLTTIEFSNHTESIKVLYLADDDFRALCNDYCTSQLFIEKYKEKAAENLQCQQEYEELSLELKTEILHYIKEKE